MIVMVDLIQVKEEASRKKFETILVALQYFYQRKSARKILKSTNLLKLIQLQLSSSGATCSEQLAHEHCNIDANVAILILGGTERLI